MKIKFVEYTALTEAARKVSADTERVQRSYEEKSSRSRSPTEEKSRKKNASVATERRSTVETA